MAFSIEVGKETGVLQTNVVPKPLILCKLAAVDGDTIYLTTSPALGGNTLVYAGNTYQARLQSNPIEQIQALSPQGYDIPGSITLTIADGDFVLWSNHANAHGWRGGTLTVTFVLWDIPTNAFSTNAYQWSFIVDKPNIDSAGILTVSGQARQSMTRLNVPNVPRQNRCSHNFPSTAAQRIDGLLNPTSVYFPCGYSPDVGGVGNIATTGGPLNDGKNIVNPNGSPLTDSAGVYVMCDYTRSCGQDRTVNPHQGCMARLGKAATTTVGLDGDLGHDTSGRATARFDGDTWLAPIQWKGRQYTNPSAGTQYGFNAVNAVTGQSYYTQGYGTQWVDAMVLEPAGDPNSTRAECVVCVAAVVGATIQRVLVNGVDIAEANQTDPIFTYYVRSPGGRDGAINADAIYDSHGDPHGSLCYIEFVVPRELAESTSIPNVRVLVEFPNCLHALPIDTAVSSGTGATLTMPIGVANENCAGNPPFGVYVRGNSLIADGAYTLTSWTSGPPGTVVLAGSFTAGSGAGGDIFYYPLENTDSPSMVASDGTGGANPVWALMDLCTWGPFTVSDFDTRTWYDAAQVCAQAIAYTDINGNAATHPRYRVSFALTTQNRQTLAKAVLGVRNAAGLILARNPANGLIQCFVEQTLADQQSGPVAGSNYNTAVASVKADGTAANGYLAYLFDGAGSIEKDSLRISGRSLNDTPNTIAFPFQDSANQWVQDTLTTIDEKGYVSSGNQEIEAPFQALGIENFDQGTRRANVTLAQALYGNSRFDAGGTELFTWRTSVKAAHLASRVGFIVGLNYEQLGLSMVLVRLLSVTPDTDGEHWTLNGRWHTDVWHTDAYGQNPAPFQGMQGGRVGPPWPWRPGLFVWSLHDAMYPAGPGFRLTATVAAYPAQLAIAGETPVNAVPPGFPPQIPLQATTASTGGSIRPGTYLIAVSANAVIGPVNKLFVKAVVPAGTNTNTITVSGIVWPPAAQPAPAIFAGVASIAMAYQGLPGSGTYLGAANDANGNPTEFTLTAIVDGFGLPDPNFQSFFVRQTDIIHGGCWGDAITSIAGGVLTFAAGAWTMNQWQNHILSLYYRPGVALQPTCNLKVLSSTANTLTVSTGFGYPAFAPRDVVVMRALASSITANTIGDANYMNSYAPAGLTVNQDAGSLAQIIAGTGAWTSAKTIASNTATVHTILGTWDVMPDASSIYIVLAPSSIETPTGTVTNDGTASIFGTVASAIPASTVAAQQVLVQVATADAAGNYFPMRYQPAREIYIPLQGPPGPNVNPGYYAITPASGAAIVDLQNGLVQQLTLSASSVTVSAPIFSGGGAIADGQQFTLLVDQDATGGRAIPTFAGGAGGFASDVGSWQIDSTASTRTTYVFVFSGGAWGLTGPPQMGGPVT